MEQRSKLVPSFGLLLGFVALLAACSSQPIEVETTIPSAVPLPTPTPMKATPSPTPTPIPTPTETDPPAWTGHATDFTGNWQRTNIYIAFPAALEISNQTENGFDFYGWALWYSHGGEIAGTAYFVDENTAFWRYTEDEWHLDEPSPTGTVRFSLSDSGILSLEQSGHLPFGMNAGIGGEYTLGEPEYITNGVLEALGPERIALLQEAAGEDYDPYVGSPLKYGYFTVEDYQNDGYSGLFLEGWWPTFGYHQKIYIGNDGAVWANSEMGQCFTNRPQEDIPDFLLFSENS